MGRKDLIAQIEKTAADASAAGAVVEINFGLPTVAVMLPNGAEYFFQGDEADDLLEQCGRITEVNESDFILWQAQGW